MAADRTAPAIFVTGTDTGVGKTLVTAVLARHFTDLGMNVGVMKPIETGVRDPGQLGPDAALLRWAAQATEPDALISPCRFTLPASPHQAAAEARTVIDIERIVTAFQAISEGKDLTLVEGAGGLMVPIRGGYLMSDLAMQMDLPVLVVTHPRLGTLNHTLLTTFAIRAMGLDLCGMVINRLPEHPATVEREAPHLLSSIASADLLGVFPETDGDEQSKVVQLADTLSGSPTYHWLLSALGVQR